MSQRRCFQPLSSLDDAASYVSKRSWWCVDPRAPSHSKNDHQNLPRFGSESLEQRDTVLAHSLLSYWTQRALVLSGCTDRILQIFDRHRNHLLFVVVVVVVDSSRTRCHWDRIRSNQMMETSMACLIIRFVGPTAAAAATINLRPRTFGFTQEAAPMCLCPELTARLFWAWAFDQKSRGKSHLPSEPWREIGSCSDGACIRIDESNSSRTLMKLALQQLA